MSAIKLICVVGPTASGKTRLAVELAQALNGEVVSCDSVQVFKELNIGSAKPDHEEMRGVRHHMIDVVDPIGAYSVADYVSAARECIRDIVSRGKTPVLAGGTGLYFHSLIDPPGFSPAAADPSYRKKLSELAEKGQDLHELLRKVDPVTAARLHENDSRRIIRALEVFHHAGQPLSSFHGNPGASDYEPFIFGLAAENRAFLYERCDRRVDDMMGRGLLEEVKTLYQNAKLGPTAGKSIGYRQLVFFLEGKCTLDQAVELIKRETRRYVKRQMTWFKRDERIRWQMIDVRPFEALIEDSLKSAKIFMESVP